MFDISPLQIMLVLGIALLVFGPRRLPELGRNLGRGIRDFRQSVSGDDPAEAPVAAAREAAPEPDLAAVVREAEAEAAPAPVVRSG